MNPGRNAPCPCGSGKKFKQCCGALSGATRPAQPQAAVLTQAMLASSLAQIATSLGAGRHAEADALSKNLLRLAPENPDAFYLAGLSARGLGNRTEAARLLARAVELSPAEASFRCGLGIALNETGQRDAAIAELEQALRLRPGYAEAANNLGFIHLEAHEYPQAEALFRQAGAADPALAEAHYNLGCALDPQDRHAEAEAAYRRALALNPHYADAFNNLGINLRNQGRLNEALENFRRAAPGEQPKPDGALPLRFATRQAAAACWNESLCHLLLGNFAEGLPRYEAGWQIGLRTPLRQFAMPRWTGSEPLQDRTILLHAEQGLGDTLQFVRYATFLAAQGARVVLEVQPALKKLLRNLPGTHAVFAQGEPLPAFDCHCPLLSLPLACATRLETVPPPVEPEPNRNLDSAWEARLGPQPRIGLVWAGNPRHENDRNRSLSPRLFASLLTLPVEFVSLQKDIRPGDETDLHAMPALRRFDGELDDFADTAALIRQLDLVISVDTSVAHLAATLGVPTWILLPALPDWRWLLDREDSPWYPAARLFRQTRPGDWQTVFGEKLQPALARFIAQCR